MSMTLDEIRKWYDANKTHTMYEGHWCRTCSIGKLLEELERLSEHVDVMWKAFNVSLFPGEPGQEYPPPPSKPFSMETVRAGYGNAFNNGDDE